VLATCNRVEVYADTEGFHAGVDAVSDLLSRPVRCPARRAQALAVRPLGGQAVLHLFQVACGLDSMVIGESQILGQLRRAYATAATAGRGRRCTSCSRRRSRSASGRTARPDRPGGAVAGDRRPRARRRRRRAARGPDGPRRSEPGRWARWPAPRCGGGRRGGRRRQPHGRAGQAAGRGAGRARGRLDGLEPRSSRPTSSSARRGRRASSSRFELVARAVERRGGRPLAILDLALPRDIDPAVRSLPGVTLVDLEGLQEQLAATEAGADVASARAIVAERSASSWPGSGPPRSHRRSSRCAAAPTPWWQAELGRPRRAAARPRPAAARRGAGHRAPVVDKLLHTPTVRVKELADAPEGLSYADALRELFGLDRGRPRGRRRRRPDSSRAAHDGRGRRGPAWLRRSGPTAAPRHPRQRPRPGAVRPRRDEISARLGRPVELVRCRPRAT
jgi:glutamyl-tRNA reductase